MRKEFQIGVYMCCSCLPSDRFWCLWGWNKASLDIHSGIVMDGQPPDQDPRGKKAMDRQKVEAVKFLFPSGRVGLWGSVEGCQIRYQHIKTSLRGWYSRGMTWSLWQNKKHTYTGPHTENTIILALYIARVQNWHMSNAIFLPSSLQRN